jgi:hypothetical protein
MPTGRINTQVSAIRFHDDLEFTYPRFPSPTPSNPKVSWKAKIRLKVICKTHNQRAQGYLLASVGRSQKKCSCSSDPFRFPTNVVLASTEKALSVFQKSLQKLRRTLIGRPCAIQTSALSRQIFWCQKTLRRHSLRVVRLYRQFLRLYVVSSCS